MTRVLFLGGTGRCGSTWARRVIGTHAKVFDVPVECTLRRRMIGKYLARAEGMPWMVEKSPMNVLAARWLLEKYPDSHYLHVTRDRAAVVESTMRGDPPRIYAATGVGRPRTRDEAEKYIDWVELVGCNTVEAYPDRARLVQVEQLDCAGIWRWMGLDPEDYDRQAYADAPSNSNKVAE